MIKKIAVVLSGCGHLDDAEIHESVLTLLSLSRAGLEYEGLAPDREQYHVMDHVSQKEKKSSDPRNILEESARIVRGNIKALANARASDYGAVIFPGGFGAAKNLFNFALTEDNSYHIYDDVLAFAQAAQSEAIPMGFICISPMIIPHIYPKGVKMTIGNDDESTRIVESLGAKHVRTNVDDICIDEKHKVVTTPAYMLGKNIHEVSLGIDRLVKAVIAMA